MFPSRDPECPPEDVPPVRPTHDRRMVGVPENMATCMMDGTEVIDSDLDSEACCGPYAEDLRVLRLRVRLVFGLGGRG